MQQSRPTKHNLTSRSKETTYRIGLNFTLKQAAYYDNLFPDSLGKAVALLFYGVIAITVKSNTKYGIYDSDIK